MYPWCGTPQNHAGRYRSHTQLPLQFKPMGVSAEIQRRGFTTLGPRTGNFAKRLRRRRGEDESGAELLEFGLVVVLLITLLYGIITYGVILAAQATITQAAADAARAGAVSSTAAATAEAQAGTDVGWMNKGACGLPGSGSTITCYAAPIACPSNGNQQCLKVTVSYNYSSNPIFPELPGLGLITPSVISSTNVVQIPAS
jgi:Flp pilus assembly protein TadG